MIIQCEAFTIDLTRYEVEVILKYLKYTSKEHIEKKDLEILVESIKRLESCLKLI